MQYSDKPMLDTYSQIEHLKSNGITFNVCSEERAYHYLRYNSNYFKVTAFRKNYNKYRGGINDGKYIDLDFAYLCDLASIDMHLRYLSIQLTLDIEHYAKLKILRLIEDHNEDGYQIYIDFMNSLNEVQKKRLENEISRSKNSHYSQNLFEKYYPNFPIWVLLELIPFGRLISLYQFCAKRYHIRNMDNESYMLMTCKNLRNASAHSSCILNDLHSHAIIHQKGKPNQKVMHEISKANNISRAAKNKRMSNERISQFVTLLYTFNKIVTSEGAKQKAKELLLQFDKRMMKNITYYNTNELIKANFEFLHQIILYYL